MVSERAPTSDVDGANTDRVAVSRRAYLLLAGSAVATGSLAGCLGDESTVTLPESVRPVLASFGFGGRTAAAMESGSGGSLASVSEREPNDDVARARRVRVGSAVAGRLGSSDVDWFSFDAEARQTVHVTLDRADGRGLIALVLYDSAGAFVTLVYVGSGTTTVDVDAAATPGTYYAQVVDVHDGSGEYELRIRGDSSGAAGGSPSRPTETSPTPTARSTTSDTPNTTQTATGTSATTASDTAPASTHSSAPASTATTTDPNATAAAASTQEASRSDFGAQGYGEYGYGGIVR